MKKAFQIMALLVVSLIILNGCWGKKSTPVLNQQNEVNVEPKQQNSQVIIPQTDERPVAVMIDNEGKARERHAGLDKAYAIYEMVAEGGETRFMALFKGTGTYAIGPVRSARHYFIHYALENDAVYVHFGWSPLAEKLIPELKVNNINGIKGVDGAIFWRSTKTRGDWQNAFTNMEKIKNMITRKKYKDTTNTVVFTCSQNELELTEGTRAYDVKIPYSYSRTSAYKYDEKTKTYKRFFGEKPHKDSLSGIQYSAKNIIIEFVKSYSLNDGPDTNGVNKGRQQVDTVGQGKGYFITNGKAVEITWSKTNKTGKTEIKDKNGNEIILNNGQTWIQIVPTSAKVTIE